MKFVLLFIIFLSTIFNLKSQNSASDFYTIDIDNFWQAFDSVQNTDEPIKKKNFIQTLYIDRGTDGLRAFIYTRGFASENWLKLINDYPKFWASIRSNTQQAKLSIKDFEQNILAFANIYPGIKPVKVYFTIGGINIEGASLDDIVFVASEIAFRNSKVDVSEFSNKWILNLYKHQSDERVKALMLHEYCHGQQKGQAQNLLGMCIKEGSCDFVAEIVIGQEIKTDYLKYGKNHDKELKQKFKNELNSINHKNWLYNANESNNTADLGYYMGYAICKSYYESFTDKKLAIKSIIELNYSDKSEVENFLLESNYYKH